MIKEQKEILKIIADFVSENLGYDIRKKSRKKKVCFRKMDIC